MEIMIQCYKTVSMRDRNRCIFQVLYEEQTFGRLDEQNVSIYKR